MPKGPKGEKRPAPTNECVSLFQHLYADWADMEWEDGWVAILKPIMATLTSTSSEAYCPARPSAAGQMLYALYSTRS